MKTILTIALLLIGISLQAQAQAQGLRQRESALLNETLRKISGANCVAYEDVHPDETRLGAVVSAGPHWPGCRILFFRH